MALLLRGRKWSTARGWRGLLWKSLQPASHRHLLVQGPAVIGVLRKVIQVPGGGRELVWADRQRLAILAHHLQACEPQVVRVPPGGGEIQLKACNRRKSGP